MIGQQRGIGAALQQCGINGGAPRGEGAGAKKRKLLKNREKWRRQNRRFREEMQKNDVPVPCARKGQEQQRNASSDSAGAGCTEVGVNAESSALLPAFAGLPRFTVPPWELTYNVDQIEQQLQPLLREPLIGLDIEWRPTFISGQNPHRVALIQLSSFTTCVLVPVKHLFRLPPSLERLLGSHSIWKVGCGVTEDARKLQLDLGVTCHATLEIGEVATLLQGCAGLVFPSLADDEKVRPGLRGLALACGYDLAKPKSVTRSNWERRPLTAAQQRYAVLDAYAGCWIATCIYALHRQQHLCTPSSKGSLLSWLAEQQRRLRPTACRSPIAQPRVASVGCSGEHLASGVRKRKRKRRDGVVGDAGC